MAGGTLGSLTVKLGLDAVEFITGLTKAEFQARKFGESLGRGIKIGAAVAVAGLATVTTAAIGAAAGFNSLIEKAGDFQDLADMVGSSAEDIASLAVAAGTAGVGIDSVTGSMIKLTKTLVEVNDESKGAGAALKSIGIEVEDFKKLDPVGQYEAIGKALAGYADGAGKTAVAVALFGKSGAEQLKVFKALEDQGGRMVILTQAQILAADEYADRQAKLRTEIGLYAQAFATEALPAINTFTEAVRDSVKELFDLSAETRNFSGTNYVRDFADTAAVALAQIVDGAYNALSAFRAVLSGARLLAEYNPSRIVAGVLTQGLTEYNKGVRATIDQASRDFDRLEQGLGLADRVRRGIATRPFDDPRILGNPGSIAQQVRGQVKPPAVTAATKAQKEATDAGQKYLENLEKQLNKTLELTTVETALSDIQSGRLKLNGKVTQEQIVAVAKLIDLEKERDAMVKTGRELAIAQGDAVTEANKEYQGLLKSLLDGGPVAQLEKQRKTMILLAEAFELGTINADQFNDAATGFLNLNAELEKGKSLTDELNLSFVSAFEDAITGGKGLRDLLKGLEADIVRIVTRQLVTKPLGDALGNLFGGSGGGAGGFFAGILGSIFGGSKASGGPIQAGGLYQVAENGPEVLDVGGRSFLMTGSKSGMIRPGTPSAGGAGNSRAIILNYTAAPGESRATAQQRMALGARELALANRRNN